MFLHVMSWTILAFRMKTTMKYIDTLWIFEKEQSSLEDTTPRYEGVVLEYLHKVKVGYSVNAECILMFLNQSVLTFTSQLKYIMQRFLFLIKTKKKQLVASNFKPENLFVL